MNRYERERPGTGGAYAAVNGATNRGQTPTTLTWWHYSDLRHEMRRALLGVDPPTAWCGDRNNRLRRFISHFRTLPAPRLP